MSLVSDHNDILLTKMSASDIIRNIWQNGIEVTFPYFLKSCRREEI